MIKKIVSIFFVLFALLGIYALYTSVFSSVVLHFDNVETRYAQLPHFGRIKLRTFLFIRNPNSRIAGCSIASVSNAFDLQEKGCVVIEIDPTMAGSSLRADLNLENNDELIFDLVRETVTPEYVAELIKLIGSRVAKPIQATLSFFMLDKSLSAYSIDTQLSKLLEVKHGVALIRSMKITASGLKNVDDLALITLSKETEGAFSAKGRDIKIRATYAYYFEGLIMQLKKFYEKPQ